jgi:ABC-type amino acid transport substrate-binding protein
MRLFLSFVVLFIGLRSLAIAAPEVVRVTYVTYPPFVIETEDPKRPSGAIVDYWEKVLAPEGKFVIEWIGPLSYLRALQQVQDGSVDAIVSIPMDIAEKRGIRYSKSIDFSARQGILMLKSEKFQGTVEPEALKGKVLAMFGGGRVPSSLKDAGVSWLEVGSEHDPISRSLQMLFAGRVSGVMLAASDAGLFYAAKIGRVDELKVVYLPPPNDVLKTSVGLSPKMPAKLAERILAVGDSKATKRYEFDKNVAKYIQKARRIPASTKK